MSFNYNGNIPVQNYTDSILYSKELEPLAQQYFEEWVNSINPQTAYEVKQASIRNNDYRNNDTTPWSTNVNLPL